MSYEDQILGVGASLVIVVLVVVVLNYLATYVPIQENDFLIKIIQLVLLLSIPTGILVLYWAVDDS